MGTKTKVLDLTSEEGFKKLSEQLHKQLLHGMEETAKLEESEGFGLFGADTKIGVCPNKHVHIDFLSPSREKEVCFTLESNGHWYVTFCDVELAEEAEPAEIQEPTTH